MSLQEIVNVFHLSVVFSKIEFFNQLAYKWRENNFLTKLIT